MTTLLLEICVDTAKGLIAAIENGADRIELCAALSEGGLTPSAGLMALAAQYPVPTRVMIRPRAGDFTYSADELAIMAQDITAVKAAGLAGVVLCVNRPNGELDMPALKTLVTQAKALGLEVALHRGFDMTPDPIAALDIAIALQIETVMTSGGEKTVSESLPGLAALMTHSNGRTEILAGSGVTIDNAAGILAAGVTCFHASCRQPLPERHDQAAQRAYELGYLNDSVRDTDAEMVAALRHHLNHLAQTAPKDVLNVIC